MDKFIEMRWNCFCILFNVAADKGSAGAQNNLGLCYYLVDGVNYNISLAIKYFSLSADQSFKKAVLELAEVLTYETKEEPKYLFQAICRTKMP